MSSLSLSAAVLAVLAQPVVAASWDHGLSRGLETYRMAADGGSVLLACDPDRVYNLRQSSAHVRVAMPADLAAQRIVFLAASGHQAAFDVRDGIATQAGADPEAWSQLIDMIEEGGRVAVVTARDSFTLDLDPVPGFRCR
ncbi:MAG: hypothetical protein RIE24_23540 [Silicimonas sp.]|uniref:hypothetical protein n=1 Tax=Marinovum algicola TaxID=42444 RepID=UPI0032EED3E6